MNTDYRMVNTVDEIREYIRNSSVVAFDFETAPDEPYRDEEKAALDPAKSHIVGCSFSIKEGSGVYVPVAHRVGKNIDSKAFYKFLAEFLTNKSIIKTAHNIAFEASFAYAKGIVIQAPVYDTICASQMTLKNAYEFRKLNESGLKKLAAELCGEPLPTFIDVTNGKHFDELNSEDKETVRYGAADSDFALRLYHKFNDWFDRFLPKHRYIVEEIESPTAVFVGLMKNNGVPMDIPAMVSAREKAVKTIESLRVQIADIIGNVDIGSNCGTVALRDYFYDELRLPVLKRTDKHAPSMDDEALLLLQENCRRNRPDMVGLFDLIFEYRKWQKLKSTYLDGYIGNVNATTGRIHPDLMQLAADTGRFACRKPNLQNQVSPGQDPIGIRNFITAPDGWTLLEADYSQAEIRLCAYLSQDKVLLDAYRHGADVHAITTSAVFGIPIEEAMDHKNPEYKHRRTVAKGTMFGIMYGIGGAGLSRNLYTNAGIDLTKEQCDTYISGILSKYRGMAAWQKEMKTFAERHMYIETAMGRRRYLPGIRSKVWRDRSTAERMAINTPVQGLGADCLKYAMSLLIGELADKPYIRPILTVHDSIVFLVRDDKTKEAGQMIKRCMETPLPLPEFMPLAAEISTGKRYGEMT